MEEELTKLLEENLEYEQLVKLWENPPDTVNVLSPETQQMFSEIVSFSEGMDIDYPECIAEELK